MRIRGPGIGILVALLVPADTVLAANQAVTASGSPNTFTPSTVTVLQGETVTWNNAGGFHNVHFDDGSFDQPADPIFPWSTAVVRTFLSAGTYSYVCEAHPEMTGAVAVQASGGTQGPGPGGGPPAPVSADKTQPSLKLGGKTTQRALRRRAVLVAVEVNEASSVVAKGTVAVPGASKVIRLKQASKQLAAGAKANLKLKLPKQAPRAFGRALDRGRRLTAKVTVTAKDAAGNTRSAKRKIALKT
jgi:plastocyanin